MSVPCPPERVFPLLCPQREHDWIEGWSATILRSASGLAEPGCVFQTGEGAPAERCTWIVVEHDPPRRVAFALVQPGLFAEVLAIDLAANGGGTTLTWRRESTPLSEEGVEVVARRRDEVDSMHARLGRALTHYLTTGRCLRAAS